MGNFISHLFLPGHSNNHRPKVLHLDAFIFYILCFVILGLSLSIVKITRPDILGVATDISVEKLLYYTNQKRAEAGFAPLTLNSNLSQAATGKAQDMFSKDYWAHNSPDGLTPWVFIKNVGYNYLYAGENLAKNFNNSEGVVAAWMTSPSHRENILSSKYQDIGFAVVNGKLNGEETTLVVQMMGARQTVTMAQKPAQPVVIPSTPSSAVQAEKVEPEVNLFPRNVAAAVKTTPLVDSSSLVRTISLALFSLLIFVLAMDTVFIWRRKTIRIAGHNFAHMIFLSGLVGIILVLRVGAVL